MRLFDGKKHAAAIDTYIRERIAINKPEGKLLIVLVGNNPASEKYVNIKIKVCQDLGIPVVLEHVDSAFPDSVILKKVKELFNDSNIVGGIVQLPLPRKSLELLLHLIPTHKDVDVISSINSAQFYKGNYDYLPPVISALKYFMLNTYIAEQPGNQNYLESARSTLLLRELAAKITVEVIGDGFLVGKPIAAYLNGIGFNVHINKKYDKGQSIYSDLVVSGAGHPDLIVGSSLKAHASLLDFGTGVLDGKITGDFDKSSNYSHLDMVSLSPGGVGPVVVRFLILNYLNKALAVSQ